MQRSVRDDFILKGYMGRVGIKKRQVPGIGNTVALAFKYRVVPILQEGRNMGRGCFEQTN